MTVTPATPGWPKWNSHHRADQSKTNSFSNGGIRMKSVVVFTLIAYLCTGCQSVQLPERSAIELSGGHVTGTHIRETVSVSPSSNDVGPPAEYRTEKVYTWRGKPREWRWIGDGWPTLSMDQSWNKREMWTMVGMLAGFVLVKSFLFNKAAHQHPGSPGAGGCPDWFLQNCIMCDCSIRP